MANKVVDAIKRFFAREDTKKTIESGKEAVKEVSKVPVIRYVVVTSAICAVVAIPIPFIGPPGGAILGAFLGVYLFSKSR